MYLFEVFGKGVYNKNAIYVDPSVCYALCLASAEAKQGRTCSSTMYVMDYDENLHAPYIHSLLPFSRIYTQPLPRHSTVLHTGSFCEFINDTDRLLYFIHLSLGHLNS